LPDRERILFIDFSKSSLAVIFQGLIPRKVYENPIIFLPIIWLGGQASLKKITMIIR